MCKKRGEVNGATAWKKWRSGLSVKVAWSGTLWCAGGVGLMARVHARNWFHATGIVWMCGSHDEAAEKSGGCTRVKFNSKWLRCGYRRVLKNSGVEQKSSKCKKEHDPQNCKGLQKR